ncbi:MAG: hypothetical protein ACTHMD_08985 [Flavisolibacter sp.]
MKKLMLSLTFCLVSLLLLQLYAGAQTNKPYSEGSLWQVDFIKTKSGMGALYLKNLSEGWIKMMEAAKKQGLITDYKVLSSEPASQSDWDLMLLYQVKNYAALDGLNDKMDKLSEQLFGSEDAQHKNAVSRNELRELYGGKVMQELIFKK